MGHEVEVWEHGKEVTKHSHAATVTGWGGEPEITSDTAEIGLNTYVTGMARSVAFCGSSTRFHELCRNNGINVIAATHSSTEKFVCIARTDYSKNLSLHCEFMWLNLRILTRSSRAADINGRRQL